jgi:hypothetical protein
MGPSAGGDRTVRRSSVSSRADPNSTSAPESAAQRERGGGRLTEAGPERLGFGRMSCTPAGRLRLNTGLRRGRDRVRYGRARGPSKASARMASRP